MNMRCTLNQLLTVLLLFIRRLYLLAKAKVQALFICKFMSLAFLLRFLLLGTLSISIVVVQKRIIHRRCHNRKDAVFLRCGIYRYRGC